MDIGSLVSGLEDHLLGENGCNITYADNDPDNGDITVIGGGLTALLPGQAIMSAAILTNCDMVAVAAGVGWVSIRHRTPAKPC